MIVTSYLFPGGNFSLERLERISTAVGKERLVVDVRHVHANFLINLIALKSYFISCRRRGDKWLVAMNKWQDITDMEVSKGAPMVFTMLDDCNN